MRRSLQWMWRYVQEETDVNNQSREAVRYSGTYRADGKRVRVLFCRPKGVTVSSVE
jgi:hypothetical protein